MLKPKILIVEDSKVIGEKISQILENEGYKTKISGNGETALKSTKSQQFDLILLDIILPGKDGYTICKEIKSDPNTKDVPVIFLTVKRSTESVVKGFENGGIDFINKPFNEKELLVRVKTHIDLRKSKIKLKNAIKVTEEANIQKSAFIANMSHEIRSPLNSILGFSELLLSSKLSDKEKYNFAKYINKSGQNLLNLINDIIDISKIEANKINIIKKDCNITTILNELKVSFENQKEKRELTEVEIKTKIPNEEIFIIKTDKYRLNQVLNNLLSNSLKFTDKGYIEFGFDYIKDKSNNIKEIEFFVKDTGTGISEEAKEKIFDRFGQDESTISRNIEGTGLGLSISKKLVRLLGGKMYLESQKDKGSTFYFTIPFETVSQNDVKQEDTNIIDTGNWETKKILVVEDVESNYLYIEALLKKSKAQIIKATNGKEAVEICKNDPSIDVILMDINIPVLNGIEATGEIRKFSKDIPIIAQTAYALDGDREKFIEKGCNDYIAKPIKSKILYSIISKFIN
ncbi:MAG: response regulator [Bacteroidota bacterium]|nr:response regulator [Bacteroidota bacterium]